MSHPGRAHAEHARHVVAAVIVAFLVALAPVVAQQTDRWQPAMDAFAELDQKTPPEKGGILFLGSSSVRFWDLEKWFPGRGLTNRGFGGSEIADSIRHFDRLVTPHAPSKIFFYAGDNDMARGKSAAEVAADFATFAGKVKSHFPETRLYYIAIKPSLARWELWTAMDDANRRIAEDCAADPLLEYVDIATPGLGADGKPLPGIFVEDGLHLNDAGYRMWTDVVEPLL